MRDVTLGCVPAGACTLAAVAGLAAGGMARAGPYQYTFVADNTGPMAAPLDAAINDSGSVLIEWLQDTGSNSIDVYGPGARNIAFGGEESQTPYFNVAYPSLNNLGQVAFFGVLYNPLQWHLQRDTAGTKTTIRTFSMSETFGNHSSMNDAGVVVFRGTVGSVNGIHRTDGTVIAQVGSDGFESFLDPSINNSGAVAFKARRNGQFGMHVGDGSTVTTLVDGSGPVNDVFTAAPSMNDSGQVVFAATLDDGGEAIYVADGTSLTPIADTTGPFSDLSWSAINNLGQVAFVGELDAGGQGIYFTSGGETPQRVIGTGDELFGDTVHSVYLKDDGLNDLGQIAFIYRLESGPRGVGIATLVPEPGSATLILGIGLLTMFSKRLRR